MIILELQNILYLECYKTEKQFDACTRCGMDMSSGLVDDLSCVEHESEKNISPSSGPIDAIASNSEILNVSPQI